MLDIQERYTTEVEGQDIHNFNCGGFALNMCKWLTPYVCELIPCEELCNGAVCESCQFNTYCYKAYGEEGDHCSEEYEVCGDPIDESDEVALPPWEKESHCEEKTSCNKNLASRNLNTYSNKIKYYYCCDYRDDIILSLMEHSDYSTATSIIVDNDIEFLINRYPFLQIVDDITQTAATDKIIAYRIFIDYDYGDEYIYDQDFHFRIRVNGKWYEKIGSSEIFEINDYSEEPWTYSMSTYDSKIVYLKDTRY